MANEQTIQVRACDCPMCANKRLGERWTRSILLGEKSSVEAASLFKITIADVEKHVYNHTTTVDSPEPTQDKDYFLKALSKINKNLEEVLDGLMMNTEIDVRKLTSLTKEVRETLKLLAEVSGIIGQDQSASMQRNMVEMQQKYLTLTGLILEECCPVCQQKIVSRLKGESDASSNIK